MRRSRDIERDVLDTSDLARCWPAGVLAGLVGEHREQPAVPGVEVEVVLVGLAQVRLLEQEGHPQQPFPEVDCALARRSDDGDVVQTLHLNLLHAWISCRKRLQPRAAARKSSPVASAKGNSDGRWARPQSRPRTREARKQALRSSTIEDFARVGGRRLLTASPRHPDPAAAQSVRIVWNVRHRPAPHHPAQGHRPRTSRAQPSPSG